MSSDRELLHGGLGRGDRGGVVGRLIRFPWALLLVLFILAGFGMVVLYSAVGGGDPGAMLLRQGMRFFVSVSLMMVIALTRDHIFRRYAYVFYGGVMFLLILVDVVGYVGMGARRWLDLGFMRLQPSEFMKVAIVLVLARYFHDRGVARALALRDLILPVILMLLPVLFILIQPDLGTAVLVGAVGVVVIFVAGLPWRILFIMIALFLAALPLMWNMLHDYQQQRILTLFDPERDPLGAGYHIIQSKIAVGSGGLFGKGFMNGSQNRLDFLPEQHTDFIFSVLAEEWGFLGAMVLITLDSLVILMGLIIAFTARDRFGLLLATGMTVLFAVQVVINIGMVIGLLPVVGIPLPLVSYGGSSMVTVMMAMGFLAHVKVHTTKTG